MTRRSFLLASTAAPAIFVSGCRNRQAFSGYAFVANREGGAIAAVDLGVFAVTKHIPVNGSPTAVLAHPLSSRVYALTPENGRIHEIVTDKLVVTRTADVCRRAQTIRIGPKGDTIYALCGDPKQLVALSTATLRPEWSVPLPAEPFDLDISADENWIAVSYGKAGFCQLFNRKERHLGGHIDLQGEAGVLSFQPDSKQLIAANLSEHKLNVYLTESSRLVVKLPLSLRPERFCFNSDGGQLFVTGEGMDGVVVVYPYFTPQIGETVLAGHSPGAMAATDAYLFVANSKSGDISILSASSKSVVAVAPAGTNPNFIAVTPDDQYALVLNEDSGDMGVILIPSIKRSRARTAALLTMIPVGSRPVSAAVVRV